LLFLERDFHFSLPPEFGLQSRVLIPEFFVLVVLHLDHAAQFFLFLGVLEEVVFDFPGLAVGLSVLLLPVVDLSFEGAVGLLHLGHHLFVLVDLDLVVLVVVDLAVQLQLLLLQLGQLLVAVFQQVVQLLQLSRQQPDLVLVVSHLQLDVLVLSERALHLAVPDPEIVQLSRLVFEQAVESFDFLRQVIVVALEVLQLALVLAVCINVVLKLAYDVLELLVLLDLVAAAVFDCLLLLLQVAVVVERQLQLVVPAFPILYFPQPRLEDAVDAVVFNLQIIDLRLVAVKLVLEVFVLGQLRLSLPHLLLPLVDLVQLVAQNAVQPVELLRCQVQLVAQFLVVVLELLPADDFFLEPACPGLPIFGLLEFGVEGLSELLAFELPLALLLELLVQLVLLLPLAVQLLVLVLEDLVEPEQLLVEQGELVLVVVDEVLVVAQLHDGDLVLLALLPVVLDLAAAVVEQLPALADLVLEGRALVLEANGHLPDFPVDHGLALALHHVAQVFELLGLALLGSLVARLPLLDLLGEVAGAVLLGLVLLLEGEVDVGKLVLEHFVLVVEGLADLVQFLVLLAVLVDLLLLREAALGELPDLHLVVAGVEELPLVLLGAHTQHLDLLREPLDLDRLEHHDELQVLAQVGLLVVGQVLDAGPLSEGEYLRRSSP